MVVARNGGRASEMAGDEAGRVGSRRRRDARLWRAALPMAVGLALTVSPALAAPILVDDFDGSQALCLEPRDDCEPQATGDDSIASSLEAAGALGGERDLELVRISGTGGARLSADDADQGQLSFTVGIETEADAILVWDGDDGAPALVDPTGLGDGGGGIDLLAEGIDALRLEIRSPTDADLAVRIYDAMDPSGATWSEFFAVLPGTDSDAFVAFDVPLTMENDSGPEGSADLGNVGALELRILGGPAQDVLIDSVQLVPEPAGGAAAALGAVALLRGLARRRAPRR